MVSGEVVNREPLRLRLLLAGMWLALLFLAAALWRIQVVRAPEYRSSIDRQSARRVRVPAPRGIIFDRHGTILADNRACYDIVVYVEELRQPGAWDHTVDRVEAVVARVAERIRMPPRIGRDEIRAHIRRRLPLPLVLWQDVGPEAVARFEEHPEALPGVDIEAQPVRTYPLGACAAHVLGYVGRKDMTAADAGVYNFYLPEMEGRGGIESACNDALAGAAGGYLITVDASGYRHDQRDERRPEPGHNVTLCLDARIQALVERALGEDRGAAVVLDPRNGDVLALASSPGYDPNAFVPRIAAEEWDRLSRDRRKPLINRAIGEIYPPGSIFKPVVAIAALENHRATAATVFTCTGAFAIGNLSFRCWHEFGHGALDMRRAIEQSCNPYFCQLGLQGGYAGIQNMARALGLGQRTGIELRGEERGIVPARRSDGDTCNVSIGQGALAVTPLQMAAVAAAIANQGTLYHPRLVRRGAAEGDVANRLNWSPETMRVVRGGMRDVIESDSGTGGRARVPGVAMAGKTGTAQFGPRGSRRKHTWMIVFAPFDAPRYAVVMVVEEGDSGGRTVAPRMAEVMQGVFQLEAAGGAAAPAEGSAA